MDNKKITAYVILLLFLVFGIIGVAAMARSVSGKHQKREVQSNIDSKTELLSRRDIDIYWIGDMPRSLADLNVKRVSPNTLNSENMPVVPSVTVRDSVDENGQPIGVLEKTTYKTYLMIVVYRAELSDSDMEIIQDCTVSNRVPILIIGKKPIEKFRDYMLKAPVSYDEDSSFSYDVTDGMVDDVLDKTAVSTGGNVEGEAIVSYIIDYFGFTDDGTETEATTESEVTVTTLPAVDEKDLELEKRVIRYRENDETADGTSAEVSDN